MYVDFMTSWRYWTLGWVKRASRKLLQIISKLSQLCVYGTRALLNTQLKCCFRREIKNMINCWTKLFICGMESHMAVYYSFLYDTFIQKKNIKVKKIKLNIDFQLSRWDVTSRAK